MEKQRAEILSIVIGKKMNVILIEIKKKQRGVISSFLSEKNHRGLISLKIQRGTIKAFSIKNRRAFF